MRSATRDPVAPSLRWVALSVGLCLAVGCDSGADGSRSAVSGTVKLDGKPLPAGSIIFHPTDRGSAARAELSEGSYHIDRREGLEAGRYTVEIVAVQPTGKKVPHPDLPSETIDEVRNIIPERYNTRSELQVDIEAGKEKLFDVDLDSRPAPAAKRRR